LGDTIKAGHDYRTLYLDFVQRFLAVHVTK